MSVSIFFYLSSGLFLGWALGANQLGNIYGTAIGTRMVSYRTASVLTAVFFVLGAVFSGSGTAQAVSGLGNVPTLAGAWTLALAVALTLFVMTRSGIPVSSTQAVIGSFIGWNLFKGLPMPVMELSNIFMAWILSPVLTCLCAFLLLKGFKILLKKIPIPLVYMDAYTRFGLIAAGIFAAYMVGANNIANVMGTFLSANPFKGFSFYGLFRVSGQEQLFFIGAAAMAVGVLTYSKRVVQTVGEDLLKMTSLEAFVVVLSQGVILFLFTSVSLRDFLLEWKLPAFPLAPISNSEAIIGGILGVSLAKGGRGLKFLTVFKVMGAWLFSPLMAMIICFIALFFVQNVFRLVL